MAGSWEFVGCVVKTGPGGDAEKKGGRGDAEVGWRRKKGGKRAISLSIWKSSKKTSCEPIVRDIWHSELRNGNRALQTLGFRPLKWTHACLPRCKCNHTRRRTDAAASCRHVWAYGSVSAFHLLALAVTLQNGLKQQGGVLTSYRFITVSTENPSTFHIYLASCLCSPHRRRIKWANMHAKWVHLWWSGFSVGTL